MNVDEIKERYSMRDILLMYGLQPNRSGFIYCPFHKERTASMKIYTSDFYCFGCGAAGDIFTFVQYMDDLTFKEAYESLGGTYAKEGNGFARKLAMYKRQKAIEHRQAGEKLEREKRRRNSELIDHYRDLLKVSLPMTEEWADAYNRLQLELYHQAQLTGIEW